MFHTKNGCRLVTKAFNSLADAENYCDYHYNLGWVIWEFVKGDYSLSDLCEADPA
jgi:hypothetical protein